MVRVIFWVLLLLAPLVCLGLHCSARSSHEEWDEVISGGVATVTAGSHTARVELRGRDELWLESEWIEMGDPLFAIGVLVRDAEGFALQPPPAAPLIVSARDEAVTRHIFGKRRDDRAFYETLWLVLALVAPVTGGIGLWRIRDD